MKKWYYHPESDSVFLDEESEIQKSPEFGLITEICNEKLAKTENDARKMLSITQHSPTNDYDNETPLGQQYLDGFDDGDLI